MPATAQELGRFTETLERRLQAVRSLCDAISEALPALASLDLAALDRCLALESSFCMEITKLDAQLAAIAGSAPGQKISLDLSGTDATVQEIAKLHSLLKECKQAQAEAAHLNRTFAHLLRRSRTWKQTLANVYSQGSLTYRNPLERFQQEGI